MIEHTKKIIASVVVSIILFIVIIAYTAMVFLLDAEFLFGWKIFFVIIEFAALGASLYVLLERIHEIKGGEEDDISKY
ncbi:MAG: hypothetical protein Ta2B_23230 [Termitinemataceae bacterium]|nr:MAG: hypothetical protein Ta2B_23230 [Termitinemataceae bacterium]